MSVTVKNGIGFSVRTASAFVDITPAQPSRDMKPTVPDLDKDRGVPWARWGTNNLFPQEMAEEIEKTGILNSIIDGKARFALCNGIVPARIRYDDSGAMQIEEVLIDPEIDDLLEENNHFFHTYGWMKDQCGFGNGVARFMLDKARKKIARFQRDDITEMRYQKMDDKGKIENLYFSADWRKVGTNPKSKQLVIVDHLNPNNPFSDLTEKVNGGTKVEFAMSFRHPGWNRKYYTLPLWYAAYNWVKIAQGVPEMKAAMFHHNFRPKYMVVFTKEFWDQVFLSEGKDSTKKNWSDYTEKEIQEKKNEIFDEIDKHLFGNENAYKTMFVDGVYYEGKLLPAVQIIPIEDKTKSGEFLPDSASANSEIAFALLFNPNIIGASMPSGPYTNSAGGSNVRESTLIQVIIHELERRNIRRIFNLLSRFNGWNKRLHKEGSKLEFLIPATIPTTLDTGSNVKPIVTGANPVDNKTPANGAD